MNSLAHRNITVIFRKTEFSRVIFCRPAVKLAADRSVFNACFRPPLEAHFGPNVATQNARLLVNCDHRGAGRNSAGEVIDEQL